MIQEESNSTMQDEERVASIDVSYISQDSHSSAVATEPVGETMDVTGEDVRDKPAVDESEAGTADDESEESEETDEESPPAEDEPSQSDLSIAEASGSANAKPKEEEDGRCAIEKQPYDFNKCTVQIAIQLLPDDQGRLRDGGPNGRMVIVGVRSHLDAPIVRALRLSELGTLPPIVDELLDELKRELPARELAAREAFEKKRIEKMKRKAGLATSRPKAAQRNKKTASARSLSDVPVASAAAIENRPRPDVQVPTNAQRQMGLF